MTKTGLLGDAFFVTYMVSAPILGLLADRISRWIIVGSAVILWSLASGGSGLAATFAILFATRIFVGIGEGGYGPAAPTILVRSLPDRNTRSHHGDFLRGDSGWQRAWLCNRWISRCSPRLALGILSRYAAGFAAGPAVLLATRSPRHWRSSGAEIAAPQHTRLPEPVPHTLLSHQLHRADIDDFCNGRFGFLGAGVSALSQSKSRRRDDDLWPDHCSRGPGLDAFGRNHRRSDCARVSPAPTSGSRESEC